MLTWSNTMTHQSGEDINHAMMIEVAAKNLDAFSWTSTENSFKQNVFKLFDDLKLMIIKRD